jgi:Spy/CpxP family protein refolding chaperone
MITLRRVLPALCIVTCLSGSAVYAATTAPTGAEAAPEPGRGHGWHHGHRGGPLGGYGLLLHKLNLTAEQKIQVKSILEGQKARFQALEATIKANRESLATTPPTDPGYPALVQTAQSNAATHITLETQAWTQIYGSVLNKAQQQAIPGIVAAAKAEREAKFAAWRAQHPNGPEQAQPQP